MLQPLYEEELPENVSEDIQTIMLASIALSRTARGARSICLANEALHASVCVEVSPLVSGRGCLKQRRNLIGRFRGRPASRMSLDAVLVALSSPRRQHLPRRV